MLARSDQSCNTAVSSHSPVANHHLTKLDPLLHKPAEQNQVCKQPAGTERHVTEPLLAVLSPLPPPLAFNQLHYKPLKALACLYRHARTFVEAPDARHPMGYRPELRSVLEDSEGGGDGTVVMAVAQQRIAVL
eukprot:755787-Hanusia_phi.AAC.3